MIAKFRISDGFIEAISGPLKELNNFMTSRAAAELVLTPGVSPGLSGTCIRARLGGRHRFSSLLRLRAATSILQEKARSPLVLEYDDRAMSTASAALKTALFTLLCPQSLRLVFRRA